MDSAKNCMENQEKLTKMQQEFSASLETILELVEKNANEAENR